MHTAGIVIHPAIYQFIREESVGGAHAFVFGKHSGAAAVEHVLAKHADVLDAAGVARTEELVRRLVGLVKELREEKLKTGSPGRFIAEYYRSYHQLGITEEEVLQLALAAKASV
jgi:isopropylmalate/homocitrate/citramalate synthase